MVLYGLTVIVLESTASNTLVSLLILTFLLAFRYVGASALLALVVLALLVVVSLASVRGLMRARRLPLTATLRED